MAITSSLLRVDEPQRGAAARGIECVVPSAVLRTALGHAEDCGHTGEHRPGRSCA